METQVFNAVLSIAKSLEEINRKMPEPKTPTKTKPRDHNPKYPPDFVEFWKVYPRPEAKAKALEAWDNVVDARPKQSVLLARTIAYAKAMKKRNTEKKYIKLPSTWLHAHCWSDQYPETSSQPSTDGIHSVSVGRVLDEESIAGYCDPRWGEYKGLVKSGEIKPGFAAWKATLNEA